MQNDSEFGRDQFVRWSSSILILILGIVVLRNAWVADDAYIAFRTVDNFVNGYGLTWNITERVQSFTNPLWVLLVSAFHVITGEVYYTSIFLSLAATLSAAWVLVKRISLTHQLGGLAIVIMISSKAFIDYSTSGLENPLSHLILVLFAFIFLSRPIGLKTFLILSAIASLGMVNRMDLALFFLPALLYMYYQLPWKRGFLYGFVGLSPFLMWEAFSLIYYGFPFPNTYYAKLHAGIPKAELASQGLLYFVDSLSLDPLTLIVIGASLMMALISKNRQVQLLGSGVVLYLLYIIWIGGDFMSGRFFAAPLLVSVVLISRLQIVLNSYRLWMLVGAVLILSLTMERSPLLSKESYGTSYEKVINSKGIADERAWHYPGTGLLLDNRYRKKPSPPPATQYTPTKETVNKVEINGFIGFFGYKRGPGVHILDFHGLADPLVARMKINYLMRWRIGHFRRSVPEGYSKTIKTGQNHIANADLAEYYDHLTTLTRSNLWTWNRFAEIIRFNFGWYDHLLISSSIYHPKTVDYSDICTPKKPRSIWNASRNIIIKSGGEVFVQLDSLYHHKALEISVDHNDKYSVIIMQDSIEVQKFQIEPVVESGLRLDTLELSQASYFKGYNLIRVLPISGDELYSLGHLRFVVDSTK